ncbi:MAG: N-formylglutamate amidohydrolase [Cytophagales bacterium]|nr:N-formylglutamate amidohydrolase [Rhizobacter sp.]
MNPRVTHPTSPSPLVLDSPHSGTDYPADFAYECPFEHLRRAEDCFVDQLFAFGPALGATLIAAPFPRSYIDVNRAPDDIDPALLAPEERRGLAPSVKSELGMGLVWRLLDGSEPIYAQPLTRAEIDARIERCWHPYHAAVAQAVDAAHQRHGHSIHINCHSMPSHSRFYPAALGHTMPFDFLVGDRDGSTASPALTQRVAAFLRAQGFVVGVNEIFKGVELVRRHGAPPARRHAIQLEVNKKLYMNEARHTAHDGFAPTQAVLQRLLEHVLAHECAE